MVIYYFQFNCSNMDMIMRKPIVQTFRLLHCQGPLGVKRIKSPVSYPVPTLSRPLIVTHHVWIRVMMYGKQYFTQGISISYNMPCVLPLTLSFRFLPLRMFSLYSFFPFGCMSPSEIRSLLFSGAKSPTFLRCQVEGYPSIDRGTPYPGVTPESHPE